MGEDPPFSMPETLSSPHHIVDRGEASKTNQESMKTTIGIAGDEQNTVAMGKVQYRLAGEEDSVLQPKKILSQQTQALYDANKPQNATNINELNETCIQKNRDNREEQNVAGDIRLPSSQFHQLAATRVCSPAQGTTTQKKIIHFEEDLSGERVTVTGEIQRSSDQVFERAPTGVYSPYQGASMQQKTIQFGEISFGEIGTVAGEGVRRVSSIQNQRQDEGNEKVNNATQKALSNSNSIGSNLEIRVFPMSPAGGAPSENVQNPNRQCQNASNEDRNGTTMKAPSDLSSIQLNLELRVPPNSTGINGGKNFSSQTIIQHPTTSPHDNLNLELDSANPNTQKPKTVANSMSKNQQTLQQALNVDGNLQKHFQTGQTNKHGIYVPPYNEFPTIFSNFTKTVPKITAISNALATGTDINKSTSIPTNIAAAIASTKAQPPHTIKITHPPPPTTIQTMATKLRARKNQTSPTIELQPPKRVTKQGCPAVLFNRDDYMLKMDASC